MRVDVTMGDGARVAAFVYAPAGVVDEPGTPFGVTWNPAPVVVLHGNGEDHEHMAAIVRPLAAERSVIAIDSRGQGASSRGTEPLSYELMAADAREVMSRLGVTQAHVLGFSDGGIVGLLLARDTPSRVLSLTTLGANLSPDGLTRVALYGMRAKLATAATKAMSDADAAGVCRSDDDAADSVPFVCEAAGEPGRYDETELLRLMLEQPHISCASLTAVTCPTCVMAGEHDLIRPEETRDIAAAISGARLVVVPDASHDLPLDAPHDVVREAAATMAAAERSALHVQPACLSHAPQEGLAVVRATLADEPGVLAIYERLLDACDEPGRETCGWRRGFWPLPHDVSRRLRAGETWIAVAAADARDGRTLPGARILGAMSLDHDFGLPGVVPDWEELPASAALTCHLLATDPDARGRGVATALLVAYAREAIARGCVALRINTSPQSLSNRLYHELGFTLHRAAWFPYEGLPLTPWTNLYELRLDAPDATAASPLLAAAAAAGAPTGPGKFAKLGISAKPGVPAEPNAPGGPGVPAEPDTSAKQWAAAKPGVSAEPGAPATPPTIDRARSTR